MRVIKKGIYQFNLLWGTFNSYITLLLSCSIKVNEKHEGWPQWTFNRYITLLLSCSVKVNETHKVTHKRARGSNRFSGETSHSIYQEWGSHIGQCVGLLSLRARHREPDGGLYRPGTRVMRGQRRVRPRRPETRAAHPDGMTAERKHTARLSISTSKTERRMKRSP